jgi:hypothetical protein
MKGVGTASPYSDHFILSKFNFILFNVLIVKARIKVDGVTVFEHPRFDDLSEIEVGIDSAKYDLEEY